MFAFKALAKSKKKPHTVNWCVCGRERRRVSSQPYFFLAVEVVYMIPLVSEQANEK